MPKRELSPKAYQAARRLLPENLSGLVRNEHPNPAWLGNSDWFWYRRDTATGHEFVFVDAQTGHRESAFDHSRIAETLSAASGKKIDPGCLPISQITADASRRCVTLRATDRVITYERDTGTCTVTAAEQMDAASLPSPDGRFAALVRDDNIWLKELSSGALRPLTRDGAPYFSYGKLPDLSMMTLTVRSRNLRMPPIGAAWSPDSRYLVVPRVDERALREYTFLQSAPPLGAAPIPHVLRRALLGDDEQIKADLFILDVELGGVLRVGLEDDWKDLSAAGLLMSLSSDPSWWDLRCKTLFAVWGTDWSKETALVAIDMVTGRARKVISETAPTHHDLNPALANAPNVRVLKGGAEVIWYSQRDGWGHLYLYDAATGRLRNRITQGPWLVFDIIHVDESDRVIYFTAGGREPGRDPYHRHLYRAPLEGGEAALLTPESADHMIAGSPSLGIAWLFRLAAPPSVISPSGRYFVDTYSTLSCAPVSQIRSTASGELIAVLESADASALWERGYRPPQPFIAKAADGSTKIYGVIYWPPQLDETRKYPVIDALYAGPQTAVAPHNFRAYSARGLFGPAALAELGFIVVTLDARGTAMRSKAFHDHGYENFGDGGLGDHLAFIRQLAQAHACVDLDRVGVYGYSFGGYFAARALLMFPDFFKAAVSMAGSHNYQGMYPVLPKYHGKPVYADGGPIRPDSASVPENYRDLDNARLAAGLKGELLLIAGDLDENAPPALTLQLAEALIKADKQFDLLIMPSHDHYSMVGHPYVVRRLWDHFVRHLLGLEPPGND